MKRKVSDEIIDFIKDNYGMRPAELRSLVKDKFGVEISLPTITKYLRRFRAHQDEDVSAIGKEIQKTIAERVKSNTDPFLGLMEDEIKRLRDIINDSNPEYVIPLDKSYLLNPEMVPRSKSHYWLLRYEAMLFEAIRLYLSLRPDPVEIDINVKDKQSTIDEILDEYFDDDATE